MGDYGIVLSTDSFDYIFVEQLRDKFFDLNIHTTHTPTSNRIRIRSKSVIDFYDYIGWNRNNIECYSYKFEPRIKKRNHEWV